MKSNPITPEFVNALGIILEEFGSCSLQALLLQYREAGEYKAAVRLEKAFSRVETWHRCERRLSTGEQPDQWRANTRK